MINTLSETLGAQEKTQEIKQSPSMKIGTKPYARSRRKELAHATGRKDRTLEARPDAGPVARQIGDRMRGPDAGGNRPDVGTQRLIEYSKVPERHICDRKRPVVGDRTLASVRSVYCRLNGRDDRKRPVRTIQRLVSSSFAGIRPQRLLSQRGL